MDIDDPLSARENKIHSIEMVFKKRGKGVSVCVCGGGGEG